MFYLYHNKSSQNHPRQFTEVSSHQSNEIIELIKEIAQYFRNHVLRDKKIMLARLWNQSTRIFCFSRFKRYQLLGDEEDACIFLLLITLSPK